jgi:hypothetical protein
MELNSKLIDNDLKSNDMSPDFGIQLVNKIVYPFKIFSKQWFVYQITSLNISTIALLIAVLAASAQINDQIKQGNQFVGRMGEIQNQMSQNYTDLSGKISGMEKAVDNASHIINNLYPLLDNMLEQSNNLQRNSSMLESLIRSSFQQVLSINESLVGLINGFTSMMNPIRKNQSASGEVCANGNWIEVLKFKMNNTNNAIVFPTINAEWTTNVKTLIGCSIKVSGHLNDQIKLFNVEINGMGGTTMSQPLSMTYSDAGIMLEHTIWMVCVGGEACLNWDDPGSSIQWIEWSLKYNS